MADNKAYIPDSNEVPPSKEVPKTSEGQLKQRSFPDEDNQQQKKLPDSKVVSEKSKVISDKSDFETDRVELKKELTLWNGVGIIVGIMIGSGIFVSPGSVVRYSGSVGMSLIVWVVTGIMCMMGALCYAEMGTMIPRSGGTYTYIFEAFGPIPAFLSLFVNLIVQSPGSRAIGLITFANYLLQPLFPNCHAAPYWAVRLVALSLLGFATYINSSGVKMGTKLQDSLTITKVFALIIIIIVGVNHLAQGHIENYIDPMEGTIYQPTSIATAFYSTLFAYGGWNSLNALVEELKDPFKYLPRAIAISLILVTLVYTLTNMAYFAVLTPNEVLSSNAVAVTFGNRTMGVIAWIISFFVACSTFGNLNGGLMAQSRLVYVAAREGQLPRCLSFIQMHNNTPILSLISIVILPAIMLFVPDVGTILAYTGFTGSLISVISISSLLWLRYKEPDRHRPIKIWLGFPIMYLVLTLFVCAFPIIIRPLAIGVSVLAFGVGLLVYYLAIYRQFQFIHNAVGEFVIWNSLKIKLVTSVRWCSCAWKKRKRTINP